MEVVLHFLVLADLLWCNIELYILVLTSHIVFAILGSCVDLLQVLSDVVLIEAKHLLEFLNVNIRRLLESLLGVGLEIVHHEVSYISGVRRENLHLGLDLTACVNMLDSPQIPVSALSYENEVSGIVLLFNNRQSHKVGLHHRHTYALRGSY